MSGVSIFSAIALRLESEDEWIQGSGSGLFHPAAFSAPAAELALCQIADGPDQISFSGLAGELGAGAKNGHELGEILTQILRKRQDEKSRLTGERTNVSDNVYTDISLEGTYTVSRAQKESP